MYASYAADGNSDRKCARAAAIFAEIEPGPSAAQRGCASDRPSPRLRQRPAMPPRRLRERRLAADEEIALNDRLHDMMSIVLNQQKTINASINSMNSMVMRSFEMARLREEDDRQLEVERATKRQQREQPRAAPAAGQQRIANAPAQASPEAADGDSSDKDDSDSEEVACPGSSGGSSGGGGGGSAKHQKKRKGDLAADGAVTKTAPAA